MSHFSAGGYRSCVHCKSQLMLTITILQTVLMAVALTIKRFACNLKAVWAFDFVPHTQNHKRQKLVNTFPVLGQAPSCTGEPLSRQSGLARSVASSSAPRSPGPCVSKPLPWSWPGTGGHWPEPPLPVPLHVPGVNDRMTTVMTDLSREYACTMCVSVCLPAQGFVCLSVCCTLSHSISGQRRCGVNDGKSFIEQHLKFCIYAFLSYMRHFFKRS